MTPKDASFEWGPESEKALQQAPASVQAAVPFGPSGPEGPKVLRVSVADRDAVWSLWPVPIGGSQHRPLGVWRKARMLQTSVQHTALFLPSLGIKGWRWGGRRPSPVPLVICFPFLQRHALPPDRS